MWKSANSMRSKWAGGTLALFAGVALSALASGTGGIVGWRGISPRGRPLRGLRRRGLG